MHTIRDEGFRRQLTKLMSILLVNAGLNFEMANRRSTMEDTFNMRIAHPFALCPVFTLLDASKQRLRLRLQRRALSLFAQ